MAFVFRRNRVGVMNFTSHVDIPNNPVSRLMYYLHCMCTVLNLEELGLDRLTNFNEFSHLSPEEKVYLLYLCDKLDPLELTGKCLFVDENIRSVAGRDNEFYSICAESTTFAATENVILGEKILRVKNVMVYNSTWLKTFYVVPFVFFKSVAGSLHADYTHLPIEDHVPSRSDTRNCCCTIL